MNEVAVADKSMRNSGNKVNQTLGDTKCKALIQDGIMRTTIGDSRVDSRMVGVRATKPGVRLNIKTTPGDSLLIPIDKEKLLGVPKETLAPGEEIRVTPDGLKVRLRVILALGNRQAKQDGEMGQAQELGVRVEVEVETIGEGVQR